MNKKISFLLLVFITSWSYASEKRKLVISRYSCQNKKPSQEDRFYHDNVNGGSFYALYDGHGRDDGYKVAHFLSENLHAFFSESIGSIEEKMNTAFVYADSCDFVKQNKFRGSTVSVVFIKDDVAHFAHVGDSRAVLEHQGSVCFFTSDHKLTRDDEYDRIEKAGVSVYWGRINDYLAVSRAIGDWGLDKNAIIAKPEYKQIVLTEENRFLVLATYGLWDVMDNEEIIDMIMNFHAIQKNICGIAKTLALAAIKKGSSDNITVMVIDLCRD
ncbi:MAG TPA: PP2C family protein-serine/threonine phosphatase [Candidatus Babeliales bacterium]|nr:PP2C family protein-serine/threonine phosphatase [Candidatus Babeliales bacterium]